MKLLIDFEPWYEDFPYAAYRVDVLFPELLVRFDNESEARRWCEKRVVGARRIAEFESET